MADRGELLRFQGSGNYRESLPQPPLGLLVDEAEGEGTGLPGDGSPPASSLPTAFSENSAPFQQ